MLVAPMMYHISLATRGCKASPEHNVDLLKMPESKYEVEIVDLFVATTYTWESRT